MLKTRTYPASPLENMLKNSSTGAMGTAATDGHNDPVPDYGSADYMAELGGEYTISTVP